MLRMTRLTVSSFLILALSFYPALTSFAQEDVAEDAKILTENMEDMDIAVLQSLDKITARTHKFEVPVGQTVRFSTIYILAQACKKAPPIEQPEAAAFLQIWQKKVEEQAGSNYSAPDVKKPHSEWVFSGWMFASSPALSSMDHPVYDVWVVDCKNSKEKQDAPAAASEEPTESTQENSPAETNGADSPSE